MQFVSLEITALKKYTRQLIPPPLTYEVIYVVSLENTVLRSFYIPSNSLSL